MTRSAKATVDFRNNVIYNVSGATNLGNCCINVINNDYRPGPDTPKEVKPLATKTENVGSLKVFLSGNVFDEHPLLTKDNWLAVDFQRWSKGGYLRTSLESIRVATSFDVGQAQPQTEPASEAYERVLRSAGASKMRDEVDQRLVKGVREQTNRLINSQDQVGGWPQLKSLAPRKDSDQDGMPDEWELAKHLDVADPTDRNGDRDNDGYTNLEEYLNGLCPLP